VFASCRVSVVKLIILVNLHLQLETRAASQLGSGVWLPHGNIWWARYNPSSPFTCAPRLRHEHASHRPDIPSPEALRQDGAQAHLETHPARGRRRNRRRHLFKCQKAFEPRAAGADSFRTDGKLEGFLFGAKVFFQTFAEIVRC